MRVTRYDNQGRENETASKSPRGAEDDTARSPNSPPQATAGLSVCAPSRARLPQAVARRSVRWPIRRARRGELRASILLVQRTPLMPPHSSLQSRCLPGKAGNNTQTRQRAAKHAPRSASTSAPTCRRLAGSRLHAGLRSSPACLSCLNVTRLLALSLPAVE